MKDWAIEIGATHNNNRFQPLTGNNLLKTWLIFHIPSADGWCDDLRFSGKQLIQGEPEALLFQAEDFVHIEARGYISKG
jgi:glutamine synthetase type III